MQKVDGFQYFEFTSFEDFENWKSKEENITNTRFVKATGDQKLKGYITKYFSCHRNGKYVLKETGKRHLKVQGSKKIKCPAKVTVICSETGNVSVRYFARHEGHTNDTSHLFTRKKQQIAEKLSLGVPFNAVIDHTRKEAGDDVSLQLITRQNLKNVYRDYQNDRQSAEASGNMGYAECIEVESIESECIEDECVQKDNIETSNGSTDQNLQNLQNDYWYKFNLMYSEFMDNPVCLKMLLESLNVLHAQARIFQDGASSFSTGITREPGNKIKQRRRFRKHKKLVWASLPQLSTAERDKIVNEINSSADICFDHTYACN